MSKDSLAEVPVRVTRVRPSPYPLPLYQSAGASGMDLHADITEPIALASLERRLIPTGIVMEIPSGFEAQVRPRSGLALKHGITCLNAPGTIDADYRGEVCVLLANLSAVEFIVRPGERIAQLVIAPVARIRWDEAQGLSETARGTGGFGSTGGM